MASRCCFGALPTHLEELPQGLRVGPMSRPSFDVHSVAEGHRSPLGEHNGQTDAPLNLKTEQRKYQHTSPSTRKGTPRSSQLGAASCHERRATSAPPPSLSTHDRGTHAAQLLSMQVFGVGFDIDNGLGRRQCVSPEPIVEARGSLGIEGIQSKKHFCGALSPRHSPSACADRAMDTIDIDAHIGYGHTPCQKTCDGILPVSSPSYSMTCPPNLLASPRASPRGRCWNYFEETLSADRYAKLIGRPRTKREDQSRGKGIRSMNLALELERREQMESGLTDEMDMETCKDRRLSMLVNLPSGSTTANGSATISEYSGTSTPLTATPRTAPLKLGAVAARLQEIFPSTATPMRAALETQRLSALHRQAVAGGASQHELDDVIDSEDQKEAYIQLILSKATESTPKLSEMPLSLRRVVASVLPNKGETLTDDMAASLRNAVRASAQAMPKSQVPGGIRKHNLSPRGRGGYRA